MGSTGATRAMGGGNIRPSAPARETVTDDYGRSVEVITDIRDLPSDRKLWASGAFGKDGSYYIVFARHESEYSIDPTSLVGLRASINDQAAVTGIAGWRSWTTSAEADKYIIRYDKAGASRQVQRRVARAKRFSEVMKKYGL